MYTCWGGGGGWGQFLFDKSTQCSTSHAYTMVYNTAKNLHWIRGGYIRFSANNIGTAKYYTVAICKTVQSWSPTSNTIANRNFQTKTGIIICLGNQAHLGLIALPGTSITIVNCVLRS